MVNITFPSLSLSPSVPDRQYEVKVWAFNKQTEGAAAVWKGRTDKPHDRRKNRSPCFYSENALEKRIKIKQQNHPPNVFVHVSSTYAPHAPPSAAPEQHPGGDQQLHLHLAALGETSLQQRAHHQLHGALQPGRNNQRLSGVLSHQVRKAAKRFTVCVIFFAPTTFLVLHHME